jgi:hypothetical protein
MKRIVILLIVCCNISITLLAQNVGINGSGAAPANCAMLDIAATDKGLLVPRVALTAVGTYAPLTGAPVTSLLVFSTSAPTGGNGVGYYYWTGTQWANLIDNVTPGNPWYVGGNLGTTASTSAYGVAANNAYLGTNDLQALVFATNSLERMRIRTDGEVVVGALTTVIADDLFSAVSNNTLDWAVNGYSGFNGSGVYGQITGGTTNFGAIQGEYYGSGAFGAGVKGLFNGTGAGTGFLSTSSKNGVAGIITGSGAYQFGIFGQSDGNFTRTGGVMGVEYFSAALNARGSLGYLSSGFADVAVYGFGQAHTNGVAAGRLMNGANKFSETNAMIGLGIYGGVMGGWVKGLVYGTNFSGDKYGIYVHGNTVTNSKYVQLNTSASADVRIASYATTALTNELSSKGKISLINGQATVTFDNRLIELCDLNSLVITATPMGNCNGVYIDNITEEGFVIKELNNGMHNVLVSFIISGTLKQSSEFTENEILNNQYETNMNGVMHNDYDNSTDALPIWYDGQNVRHDPVPRKGNSEGTEENKKLARQKYSGVNTQTAPKEKNTQENK